ncbi:GH39 family glycosyl hydrolase [Paenibacillus sanguinis]|uniref:GH39 family glycosyl hydrolase n=1 Tax=Paenibacillus sanguinis TaxID=225906 RepID=UPI00036946EF|nr:helix-turn-helix domain-containing protein [Paenibacillus sanguinis]
MKHTVAHIPYQPGCPYYFTTNDFCSEAFHQHAGLELLWLMSGRLKVTLGSQDYDLQPNDLLLINHLESHRLISQSQDVRFIQLHIDSLFLYEHHPNFYDLIYDLKSFKNSPDHQNAYDIVRTFMSRWLLIDNTAETDEPLGDVLRLSRYLLLRFGKPRPPEESTNREARRDHPIVQHILSLVELNFKSKMTLNQIAEQEHYNSSYLSDIFRRHAGITFKTYLDEVRIRYSLYLLLHQEASILNIALASGFSDEKSYYKAIKSKYACTPLQLRRSYQEMPQSAFSLIAALPEERIRRYASMPIELDMLEDHTRKIHLIESVRADGYELEQVWNKMMNIGSANTLLNQNIRDQIQEIQEDIPIEYMRFEGIFNQEMDVLQKDRDGFKFNWKFINNILDYLRDIELKPFICLSYMPPLLASKGTSFFNYQGNTSPPKEMHEWLALVQSFITNCINRYGLEAVSTWYFQIWTEFPVQDIHWSGTLEQYFELYKQTALLIKGISPSLKVGPAAENFHTKEQPSEKLLEFCLNQSVPVDFYSCNVYHNRIHFDHWQQQPVTGPVDIQSIPFQYETKHHTKRVLKRMWDMLESRCPNKIEFIVTRWNLSWDVTHILHDTAFMATFIIDNMLDESAAHAKAIGFLSASDILYEWDIKNTPFYGGTGLMTTEGIKKSAYYAFVFLSKLGGTVFAKGKNYMMTRQGENIQIIVYNHTYLNQLFVKGEETGLPPYDIFEESEDLLFHIHLQDIYGTYKCKQYSLNRQHGSAYDEWIRMGEYVDLNHEETEHLKSISRPSLQLRQVTVKGNFEHDLLVPVHGVECLILNKLYN